MTQRINDEKGCTAVVYKSQKQQREERTHLDERDDADLLEHDRPRKQKGDFKIENDEQDRKQVIAHVELHARVLERGESAFVGGGFHIAGAARPEQRTDHEQRNADTAGDDQEQQDR